MRASPPVVAAGIFATFLLLLYFTIGITTGTITIGTATGPLAESAVWLVNSVNQWMYDGASYVAQEAAAMPGEISDTLFGPPPEPGGTWPNTPWGTIFIAIIGILGAFTLLYLSDDRALFDTDPLDAIEETDDSRLRYSWNSYGEFKRVERTPVQLRSAECSICGRTDRAGYRIERFEDTVRFGVIAHAERNGVNHECVGCAGADPADLELGTALHLSDAELDLDEIPAAEYEQYRTAYRDWHHDRIKRIRAHEVKLRDEKNKVERKLRRARNDSGPDIPSIRDLEAVVARVETNLQTLTKEMERMNERDVPKPIPSWPGTEPWHSNETARAITEDYDRAERVPAAVAEPMTADGLTTDEFNGVIDESRDRDADTDADGDPDVDDNQPNPRIELSVWDPVLKALRQHRKSNADPSEYDEIDERIAEREAMHPDFAGEVLTDPSFWDGEVLAEGENGSPTIGCWAFPAPDLNLISVYYRIPSDLSAADRSIVRQRCNTILRAYGRDPDEGPYSYPAPISDLADDAAMSEKSADKEV